MFNSSFKYEINYFINNQLFLYSFNKKFVVGGIDRLFPNAMLIKQNNMTSKSFAYLYICSMLKAYWDKVPTWLKNRYSLTVIAFTVWMVFFDSNDVFMLYKLKSELRTIRQEKEYFEDQIEQTRADLDNLLNDKTKLEKFAREKYLMKNDNEDIFVVVVED